MHKNPLFISILDGVDTLKAMSEKSLLPLPYLNSAKGLLFMKTDKVAPNCVALLPVVWCRELMPLR